MEVRFAKVSDIERILKLLKENHADNVVDKTNGFVTTNITREQLKDLIEKENGVVIAEEGEKLLSFAFAAPWKYWSQWPLFEYMIEILPDYKFKGESLSVENSYQYGPVCVDESARGNGVFEEVFFKSLESMNRFPIMATFINTVNPRSYRAHTKKAGMEEIGKFKFNGNTYYFMAIGTDHKRK